MKLTLTRKGTRATAADTAEDILEYDPKTVGSTKKEKEDNENLECKKRNTAITEWIGQPFNPPCATRTRKMGTNKKMSVTL